MEQWLTTLYELSEVERFVSGVKNTLLEKYIAKEQAMDIQLALLEVLNNCFVHGGKKDIIVDIVVSIDHQKHIIQFVVEDNGVGYNPEHQIKKEIEEWDVLSESGKGLFLIHQLMDDVWFNETGNKIIGTKKMGLY